MGYTTDFFGQFTIDKPVDDETKALLDGLANTRRMARNVDPKYGVEGEFYFEGTGFMGQDHDNTIIDYNRPPKTQPGLWCQWVLDEDNRQFIYWDEGEKFYNYVEWIEYIISKILEPRGYKLNGEVEWHGEDYDDMGKIIIRDNIVKISYGKIIFDEEE